MNVEIDEYEFDIAISFAGEDRAIAEEIAFKLKIGGAKIFYDEYQVGNLWGKDLYIHLTDVYKEKSNYPRR